MTLRVLEAINTRAGRVSEFVVVTATPKDRSRDHRLVAHGAGRVADVVVRPLQLHADRQILDRRPVGPCAGVCDG